MTTPSIAANAYSSLSRLGDPTGAAKGMGDAAAGPNFGKLLKDAIGSVAQSSRATEAQSQAMVAGKANIVDVITAVAESEVAIDTLVSVRDRVIQSYEEIMKMPI